MKYRTIIILTLFGIINCVKDYEYDLVDELDENSGSSEKTDGNIEVRLKDLGWKIICEEDEWKMQFEAIRTSLTDCVKLKKIVYDEQDGDLDANRKMDHALNFGKPEDNPYCKLSKYWKKCAHLMQGIDCIEPNGNVLLTKKRKSQLRDFGKASLSSELTDPYDWVAMYRPYKALCEIAKVYSKVNPFELLAGF